MQYTHFPNTSFDKVTLLKLPHRKFIW